MYYWKQYFNDIIICIRYYTIKQRPQGQRNRGNGFLEPNPVLRTWGKGFLEPGQRALRTKPSS